MSERASKRVRVFLGLFFIVSVIFLSDSHIHIARAAATAEGQQRIEYYKSLYTESDSTNVFLWALSLLIYAILHLVSYIVSLGASLLEFVLNPIAFSGLFNLTAIYNLWRMVRDFLNLFFILTILFIAFATIFQVQAYSYKKLLFNLVLMALLTNFSFPVARFLIDVTNVPMYFFLDSLSPNSSTGSAGTALNTTIFKASDITEKILPGSNGESGEFVVHGVTQQIQDMLLAIVFVFIFGISLIVLAILLFVRALTLLILVIFSPIGFVGTAIPWLNSYAKQWWDNFMKYAFFGPVSALMLLVSANVMTAFNSPTIQDQLKSISTKTGSGSVLGISLASSITTMVPVILIWMSISVGQSMGIAGAKAVSGRAEKFIKASGRNVSKWGGKGALFVGTVGQADRIGAYAKGTGAALKNVTKTGQLFGKNVGGEKGAAALKYIGKSEERKKDQELRAKNIAEKGWAKGTKSASEAIHKRNVADKEKEFEEKKHDDAKLREYIDPTHATYAKATAAEKEAAARILVKKGALRSQADLDNAIATVPASDKELKAEFVRKTGKDVIQNADGLAKAVEHLGADFKSIATLLDKVDGDAVKMNLTQYQGLLNGPAFASNPALKDKLNGRLRKEGRVGVIIDHEVATGLNGRSEEEVYHEHLDKMTAAEIGKMRDLHGDNNAGMNQHLKSYIGKKRASGDWTIRDTQEAFKSMKTEQRHSWKRESLA